MRMTYNITDEMYAEVIAYQMKLDNNRLPKVLKFWISNILFMGAALYFLIFRPDYDLRFRIALIVMALILLILSGYKRFNIPKRAISALRRYKKTGQLQDGFIGQHTLIIENGKIRRQAGQNWQETTCDHFSTFISLEKSVLMIADGIIFDILPKTLIENEKEKNRIQKALSEGRTQEETSQDEALQINAEEADLSFSWKVERNTYIDSMVQGHRLYYSTPAAWKNGQAIRLVILLYGVIVLCLRANIYIGVGFTVLGLFFNRRIITSFSVFSSMIVNKQLECICGKSEQLGKETGWIKDGKITLCFVGQEQSAKKAEIKAMRQNMEYIFLYTISGGMLVIAKSAFKTEQEQNLFFKLLNIKKGK